MRAPRTVERVAIAAFFQPFRAINESATSGTMKNHKPSLSPQRIPIIKLHMLFCILSKIIAALSAFVVTQNFQLHPLFQAFLVGICPIWFEVIASYVTKVEPAKEKRRKWVVADAIADATAFIILPALWYFPFTESASKLALVFFISSGIARITRFVMEGLNPAGSFEGLPVTYTGYLWCVLVLISNIESNYGPAILLVIISVAMVTKQIQIRPSR
jgi:hypothetical protein